MFSALLSWFASGGIAAVGKQLTEAYAAKLRAKNSTERVEADKLIAQLEGQRAVVLAEQGRWLTSWIRPAFAAPFVIYLWKLVVYDKVLGLGSTDDLSPALWHLLWVIAGAYFLTRPLEKRRRS